VLFPMGPQVLDGIELWRVGRQKFKLYVAGFALDLIARPRGWDGLADDPR
jgi:hypothetical protein